MAKGLIQFGPAAGVFAGMGADPAADGGQHIVLPDQIQGFRVSAGLGQGHIPLGIDPQGAVGLAEGLPAFVDHRPARQAQAAGRSESVLPPLPLPTGQTSTHRPQGCSAVRVHKGLPGGRSGREIPGGCAGPFGLSAGRMQRMLGVAQDPDQVRAGGRN